MRVVLVGVLALVACACAAEVRGARGYHADVGIPLAASLRAAEEKMNRARTVLPNRIINGQPAPLNAHPFFGGLLINFINHFDQSVCGSSLVSANRLVTAAHCWFDGWNQARSFLVILGSNLLWSGGQRISTSQVVMHPQWMPSNLMNDIAMIYLPRPVLFSVSIQPIVLPTANDQWNDFAGHSANAVGFGRTRDGQPGSTFLNHVNLPVITNQQCRAIVPEWGGFIFQSTLCTNGFGGVGVCSGDSGGPLTIRRNGQPLLIGVASFAAQDACERGLPSGFARVTSFLSFINQHMSPW